MRDQIPENLPDTPLLDKVSSKPQLLRQLPASQLPRLAGELRDYLMYSVGQSGGHFGAGLGVVELTIALHYVFNTPDDRLIWDVGHQSYPHKILTNRKDVMLHVRSQEGPAPFPVRDESVYDFFGVGHSSTSISAALGSTIANKLSGSSRRSVAIIGDGAITAGMAFEALNHAGGEKANLLIVLNDNSMSISQNVGALSNSFTRFFSSHLFAAARSTIKQTLKPMPHLSRLIKQIETHGKGMVLPPSTLFEALNCHYLGPVDGHDLSVLVETLENARRLEGVQVLHVRTVKGKGYSPAERDPVKYHALSKIGPLARQTDDTLFSAKKTSWSNVFGRWICDMAEQDDRVIAITPAMKEGSDLTEMSQRFPDRYYDVAIAEQHALTFAAGLACERYKPVVAIYSTFLQRAYDQLIHDVCLQNLDVTFAVDRAGFVGEDGPTHHGIFDLSFCRCLPNILIMSPATQAELRSMLSAAWLYDGPAMVRYPRGEAYGENEGLSLEAVEPGKAVVVRQGDASLPVLLAFGSMVQLASEAAEKLDCTLVNMRSIKPLDHALLKELCAKYKVLISLEENSVAGGAGSAVFEWMQEQQLHSNRLHIIGVADKFIAHGSRQDQLDAAGLSSQKLLSRIADIANLCFD